MADYRGKIYELDNKIKDAQDNHERLMFLDEAIEINKRYAHILRRAIPTKIVFGILILPLGLVAFFPQAIVRGVKAHIAINRAKEYEVQRDVIRDKNR